MTVCDAQGIILYMNERAVKVLSGTGKSLVGQNVLDCHPEPARTKLVELLQTQASSSYTIEKNGVKKLIHRPGIRTASMPGLSNYRSRFPLSMRIISASQKLIK